MTAETQGASLRNRTVGELAATMPGATAVFRKFKLDFCCRGDVALGEAAEQRGVDADDVERELRALEASSVAPPETWESEKLIDHILVRYHQTHRRELRELVELARKVEAVHADHPQAPRGLTDLLQQMQGELEIHMKKEELILFPAMQGRSGRGLDAPIGQMRHDHADHGERLQQLQDIAGGFALPEGACRSWQALYCGAAKLAADLMDHIHLENNVLFPRYQGT